MPKLIPSFSSSYPGQGRLGWGHWAAPTFCMVSQAGRNCCLAGSRHGRPESKFVTFRMTIVPRCCGKAMSCLLVPTPTPPHTHAQPLYVTWVLSPGVAGKTGHCLRKIMHTAFRLPYAGPLHALLELQACQAICKSTKLWGCLTSAIVFMQGHCCSHSSS